MVSRTLKSVTMAAIGGLFAPTAALACAVCSGDAESPMAQGAVAGVAVLGAIVGCVLVCVASIGLTWYQRSLRVHRLENQDDRP